MRCVHQHAFILFKESLVNSGVRDYVCFVFTSTLSFARQLWCHQGAALLAYYSHVQARTFIDSLHVHTYTDSVG
jgi:hypothetical protein